MTRRDFIFALHCSAAAMLIPLHLSAQSSAKVWRIGLLETISMELNASNLDAFRRSLRDLGYVEGQNLIIEYRSAEGRGDRFADLAAGLLRLNVDAIVTRGTPAALAARKATTITPIVMAAIGEPFMVVSNLAHPGGNITGLSGFTTELETKRAEVIKELVPNGLRIAGLYDMGNPSIPPQWKQFQIAAAKLGIEPQLVDIRKPEDIEPAFDAAIRQHADARRRGC
jgi:putative ABC transport system substrate-binding protein